MKKNIGKKYQKPCLHSHFKPKNQIRLQKWRKIENFWEILTKRDRKKTSLKALASRAKNFYYLLRDNCHFNL